MRRSDASANISGSSSRAPTACATSGIGCTTPDGTRATSSGSRCAPSGPPRPRRAGSGRPGRRRAAGVQGRGAGEALASEGMRGARVLLARAAEAREVLPAELTRGGATVDVVPAYRTVRNTANAEELRAMLRDGKIDAVTFTSSSTVRYFLELVGPEGIERLRGVVVASIGPITRRRLPATGSPATSCRTATPFLRWRKP